MAPVSNTNIVEDLIHSLALPDATKDSFFLSSTQAMALRNAFVEQQRKNDEYEALLAKNKKHISSYEQLIVDLKCELAKMQGKEDEYKLQIRQLTEERNDCKCKPEEECSQHSQSLTSSVSFQTKNVVEEMCKPNFMKRRGSRLVGNLFPAKDSIVQESLRDGVRSLLTKRRQSATLNVMADPSESKEPQKTECVVGSSALTKPQQTTISEVMASESESKASSRLEKECNADDFMLSKLELNAAYEVTENQTKSENSSSLEKERSMINLMWKHALDLDRSEILLREELIRS